MKKIEKKSKKKSKKTKKIMKTRLFSRNRSKIHFYLTLKIWKQKNFTSWWFIIPSDWFFGYFTSWWRECCLSWLSSDCNASFFTDHCSCMSSNDVWRPSTSFCEEKKSPVGKETWPSVSFLMEKIQNSNRKEVNVPFCSVFSTKK